MSNDIERARLRALCNDRSHGRISRRTFLAGASALGFTMTAGGVLLPTALAATPKRGGRMVLAMGHGATSDTTDPATLVNGYQWTLSYAMTNTLTEIDADMKVIPSLAESWESSPDAVRWTFRLRKGVEFQNGRSFTARDVVASVRHHMGEDSKSFIKPIVDQIESMKADGDHVVSFTLKSGDADFPFSLDSAGLCIYPARDDGTMDWESGAGTGGYILKGVRSGRARLARAEPELLERGPCLRRRGRVSHRRGSGRTHQRPHQRLGGRNRSGRPEDCSPARAQAGDPRRGGVRSSSLHVSDAHRHRAV